LFVIPYFSVIVAKKLKNDKILYFLGLCPKFWISDLTDKSFNEFYPFLWWVFLNPFKSVNLIIIEMGKIAQKCLKWVEFTVKLPILDIFGQFYPFWLVKELPIWMSLKKLITKMGKIHWNFYLWASSSGIWPWQGRLPEKNSFLSSFFSENRPCKVARTCLKGWIYLFVWSPLQQKMEIYIFRLRDVSFLSSNQSSCRRQRNYGIWQSKKHTEKFQRSSPSSRSK
jgi:hypothetical protein